MKRLIRILIPVIASILWITDNGCHSTYAGFSNSTNPLICEANGNTSDNCDSNVTYFEISEPDMALPVQIEKLQVSIIHLTARQQLKRLSETVYGQVANRYTTHRLVCQIYHSCNIILNLESFDIGFPFSYFW